jgi:hypothetical protein
VLQIEGAALPGSSKQQQSSELILVLVLALQELTSSQAELLERIQKLKQVRMDFPTLDSI